METISENPEVDIKHEIDFDGSNSFTIKISNNYADKDKIKELAALLVDTVL